MTDPAPYGAGSVSSDGTLIIKEIAIKRDRLITVPKRPPLTRGLREAAGERNYPTCFFSPSVKNQSFLTLPHQREALAGSL